MRKILHFSALLCGLLLSTVVYSQEVYIGSKVNGYIWDSTQREYVAVYHNKEVDFKFYWEYKKTSSIVVFVDGKMNSSERILDVEVVKHANNTIVCNNGTTVRLIYIEEEDKLLLYYEQDSAGRYSNLAVFEGHHYNIKLKQYKKALKPYKLELLSSNIKI